MLIHPHIPPPSLTPKSIHYGSILHLDGDRFYLSLCTNYYKTMHLPFHGFNIKESMQPTAIYKLLTTYKPRILIITGHDALRRNTLNSYNLKDYRNSTYFAECIKISRTFEPNLNRLVIIAGGCESYYELLVNAGANFASSPYRTSLDALDAAYIAYKFSITPNHIWITPSLLHKEFNLSNRSIDGIPTKGQAYYV